MGKKGKKIKIFPSDSVEMCLSEFLLSRILERRPQLKRPNMQAWAKEIDYMIRLDKRDPAEIKGVIEWCQEDPFWQKNILSTEKLREKYDQLFLSMDAPNRSRDVQKLLNPVDAEMRKRGLR